MTIRNSKLNLTLLAVLIVFLFADSIIAADALRIYPTKLNCGIIEEGVPATMLVTIENISTKNVNITGIRTN